MKLAVAAIACAGLLLAGFNAVLYARSSGDASGATPDRFVGSEAPTGIVMPSFILKDHDGRSVRSSDLRGKVVVLTFLDTKCEEACPIIASEVASGWRLLSSQERRRAVAVAVSTDPRDDTPANVREFLRRHRALGTFRYLTGPVPEMKRLWSSVQILSSLESGDADTHSAPVRVYSREGTWLATLHPGVDLTPASLAHDIREALSGSSRAP